MLLNTSSVFVFWLDLDQTDKVTNELAAELSKGDRRRVSRYVSEKDRRRATVRMARRRQIMSSLIGVHADDVDIQSDARGKTFAMATPETRIELTSSHCEDVGVVACTIGRQIGIDVESSKEFPSAARFVSRIATSDEEKQISAVPAEERSVALLTLWTRKEAYLKATGEGIGSGTHHIEVPLNPSPWGQSFQPEVEGAEWLLYELPCRERDLKASLVVSTQCDVDTMPAIYLTPKTSR